MSKILITSALPYINGVKHLGNLVGSLLPADVQARFRRQCGQETLFICGSDEHGTPAELAAQAAGQDIRRFCDEQHAVQGYVGAYLVRRPRDVDLCIRLDLELLAADLDDCVHGAAVLGPCARPAGLRRSACGSRGNYGSRKGLYKGTPWRNS